MAIGDAERIGDTRGIYNGVKALARKRDKPPTNLNTDGDGNMLKSAEEVAETWHRFLKAKSAVTAAESKRPAMETLPCTNSKDGLSEAQFKQGLQKMNTGKAVGPDRIPTKPFNHSSKCQQRLCELIQKIWLEEEVLVAFARATFVMLFKNKGSSNDPKKYRCIGLNPKNLNRVTSLLSVFNSHTESTYMSTVP